MRIELNNAQSLEIIERCPKWANKIPQIQTIEGMVECIRLDYIYRKTRK
jgi:hypothetical protein